MADRVAFALLLTLLAGLSTGIGSILACCTKRTGFRFLSMALGFSAGVMIYVSMVEIFQQARLSLADALGPRAGDWVTVGAFFGGIGIAALIDRLVPAVENPHELHRVEELDDSPRNRAAHLKRMGLFTAVAIALHNFPEGMATFTAALTQPSLGIAVALAIAIHNIPEGIAVSVPLYYATGNRRKAFAFSFLSGMAEPLGALIGWLLLRRFLSSGLFGIVLAAVAGIMVFISLDELLPAAREYGQHHWAISGLIAGMAVMALSLLLFL